MLLRHRWLIRITFDYTSACPNAFETEVLIPYLHFETLSKSSSKTQHRVFSTLSSAVLPRLSSAKLYLNLSIHGKDVMYCSIHHVCLESNHKCFKTNHCLKMSRTVSTDVIEYIHFMKTLTRRIADFRDGKLVLRDVASIGNCKNPLPPIGWNLHMKQRPQTRNPFVKAAGAADSQDEATEIEMKILQPNNDDTATEDVSHDKHDDGEKVLEGVTIETIQRIVAHRTSPSYACQSPVDIARRYQATMPCGELTQNCECVPPLMYAYPAQQLNHISSADAHPRSKTKPDDVDYKDRQEDEGEIEDEAQCNTPDAEDTNCNHTEPRRLQFLTRMPQPNPAPPRAITNTRLPSLIIDVYDLNPADEPRYPSGRASERLTRVECSRPGSAKEGSQAIHSRPRFSKPIDEELFLRLMRRGCSRSSCLSRFCHHRPYSIATEAGNGGISVVPKRKMSTSKQGRQYAAVKAFCDSGHKRSSKRARKRWAKTMKRLMRMDEIPGEAMFIVRRKTTNRGIVVRRDS